MKKFFMLAAGMLLAVYLFAQEVPVVDWDELNKTEPWKATEQWTPVPPKVTPGIWTAPPSDAIILFDGTNLSNWHKPKYDYGVNMETVSAIIKVKTETPNLMRLIGGKP